MTDFSIKNASKTAINSIMCTSRLAGPLQMTATTEITSIEIEIKSRIEL